MRKIFSLFIIFLVSCSNSNVNNNFSIQSAANHRIISMRISSKSRVVPIVYGDFILVVGQVANASLKNDVTEELSRIKGISGIYNELEIAEPISLFEQTSDSIITGKVKANFYNNPLIPSKSIKVITENSNIYLLGHVFRSVADLAAQLSKVEGSKKIILLFNYLD